MNSREQGWLPNVVIGLALYLIEKLAPEETKVSLVLVMAAFVIGWTSWHRLAKTGVALRGALRALHSTAALVLTKLRARSPRPTTSTTTHAPVFRGAARMAGIVTLEAESQIPANVSVAASAHRSPSEIGLPPLSNIGFPSVSQRDVQYAAARHWYGQSTSTPLPLRAATIASTS